MTDPISTAMSAVASKVLELLKGRRLYDHVVGWMLFVLLLSFFSLNRARANYINDPPTIAANVFDVMGLPGTSQVDRFSTWVGRPDFVPVLWLCAASAGIALLWRSPSGAFTAWLLWLFAASGIGWDTTLQISFRTFGAGLAVIVVVAFITGGRTKDGRSWLPPGTIIFESLAGAAVWIFVAPLSPVLEAMRALRLQYTRKAKREPAPRPAPVTAKQVEMALSAARSRFGTDPFRRKSARDKVD